MSSIWKKIVWTACALSVVTTFARLAEVQAAPPLGEKHPRRMLRHFADHCGIEHVDISAADMRREALSMPRNTWSYTTLMGNGPVNNRVDLVFVGDGYTTADLTTYEGHINNVVTTLFNEHPFDVYAPYFNVHRVDVISNESGVDEPGSGIYRDTAMDMSVSATSRGISINLSKARAAAASAPDEDQILASANTTSYGGSGYYSGDLGTFPGGNGIAARVAVHEFGHSFGNLTDEYVETAGSTYTGGEPYFANVSIYDASEQTSQLRKWYRWLDLPNIDTFEGGYYRQYGIFRPSSSSRMRSNYGDFEEVNSEQLIRLTYETVSPIDDATPEQSNAYLAGTTFSVTPMQPVGHNLDVQWAIDGADVAGATGNSFTPDYATLSDIVHTVTVTVVDNTTLVRDENLRSNLMTATRTWTVQGGYPGTPLNLVANGDADSINLDWDDNAEPDIVNYVVYRATASGGPYTQIAAPTASAYDDTSAVTGVTYYYVVSAFAQGNESDTGNEDFATAGVSLPAAPQNLVASVGEEALTLDWDDNSESNLTGYTLYRSDTTGGPYTPVTEALIASSDYVDAGLVNDQTYYYVVSASDAYGNEGTLSAEAVGTPTNLPPAAPTGLVATPGDRKAYLSWDANTEPDFREYRIYYSDVAGGPYDEIDSDDVTSWVVGGLNNGQPYYFVVEAVDEAGAVSPYSNEATTTPIDNEAPGLPYNITTTGNIGTVYIEWTPPNDSDFYYVSVYRSSTSGGPYTFVDFSEDPEFLDSGLTNDQDYYYVLTATDGALNESGYTAEFVGRPLSDPPPPTPTNLTATAGANQISLDWNDVNDPDFYSYRLLRSTSQSGPFGEVWYGSTSAHVDANVVNGTRYYYVVTAVDFSLQESEQSNVVNAVPFDSVPPAAPQNLVGYPLSQGAYLDWDDNTEPDFNVYLIYYSLTAGGPYEEYDGDDPSEFPVYGLTNGTTYYFVVTAVDDFGNESGFSNEVSVTPEADPVPMAPRELEATPDENAVDLEWLENWDPDIDLYTVYRSTTSGGPYAFVGVAQGGNYYDNSVTGGTTYYYVVTATDEAEQESAYSNEVSVTPIAPVLPPDNVSATAGFSSITVSWSQVNSPQLTGYIVYRSTTSGGPYSSVAAVQSEWWTDQNVAIGTTYYYVVTTLYDGQSETGFSQEASATLTDTTPPAAPSNLAGNALDGAVDLSWDANSESDLAVYVIYIATSAGGPYTEVDNDDATSFYVGGLTNDETYYFVVTAMDTSGNESGYSNEIALMPFDPNQTASGYNVQSGRAQITGSTLDVSIAAVDTDHAFVLLSYGTGYQNGNTNANQVIVRGDLLDSDTLRLYRGNSGNSSWVSWQVIECVGGEFTAYRGSGSFSNSQGAASLAIGATVNPADCLALVYADTNSNSRSYFSEAHLTAYVDSASTVRVERADTGSSSVDYNWTVVEFDASKIDSIQSGSLSFSNPRQNSRATASIASVNPATSLLLFQSRTDRNGLAYTAVAGQLTGAGDGVEFYQHTGSNGTRTVEYTVIDFGADAAAQRGQIDNSGNRNWSAANASLSSVDTASSMHFHSMTCNGTGTAYPRSYSTAEFTSSSNLRIERQRWGQQSYIEWQVVELPAATNP